MGLECSKEQETDFDEIFKDSNEKHFDKNHYFVTEVLDTYTTEKNNIELKRVVNQLTGENEILFTYKNERHFNLIEQISKEKINRKPDFLKRPLYCRGQDKVLFVGFLPAGITLK